MNFSTTRIKLSVSALLYRKSNHSLVAVMSLCDTRSSSVAGRYFSTLCSDEEMISAEGLSSSTLTPTLTTATGLPAHPESDLRL